MLKKHEAGWALNTHPSYSPIFILSQWQKEGFSHQLHSESEAVGEGVALGNAVHLVHAVLKISASQILSLDRLCLVNLAVQAAYSVVIILPLILHAFSGGCFVLTILGTNTAAELVYKREITFIKTKRSY